MPYRDPWETPTPGDLAELREDLEAARRRPGAGADLVRAEDFQPASGQRRCVAHGMVTPDDAGRCPVVITAEDDCGYGDPCGRLLADEPFA